MSVFPHPHYRRVLLEVASTLAVSAAGLAAALPASASPAPAATQSPGARRGVCRAVLGCGRRVGSHGLLPARGQWSCGGAPARRCCAGRGPVG